MADVDATARKLTVVKVALTHSLTHSLTDSCLVNLIDVTLACEDANSKLVEIVTDADC